MNVPQFHTGAVSQRNRGSFSRKDVDMEIVGLMAIDVK